MFNYRCKKTVLKKLCAINVQVKKKSEKSLSSILVFVFCLTDDSMALFLGSHFEKIPFLGLFFDSLENQFSVK